MRRCRSDLRGRDPAIDDTARAKDVARSYSRPRLTRRMPLCPLLLPPPAPTSPSIHRLRRRPPRVCQSTNVVGGGCGGELVWRWCELRCVALPAPPTRVAAAFRTGRGCFFSCRCWFFFLCLSLSLSGLLYVHFFLESNPKSIHPVHTSHAKPPTKPTPTTSPPKHNHTPIQ